MAQVGVSGHDGPFMKGGVITRLWSLTPDGSCEMLQTAGILSAGKLRPDRMLHDVPNGMTPEQGSKDGCLGSPPPIQIVS